MYRVYMHIHFEDFILIEFQAWKQLSETLNWTEQLKVTFAFTPRHFYSFFSFFILSGWLLQWLFFINLKTKTFFFNGSIHTVGYCTCSMHRRRVLLGVFAVFEFEIYALDLYELLWQPQGRLFRALVFHSVSRRVYIHNGQCCICKLLLKTTGSLYFSTKTRSIRSTLYLWPLSSFTFSQIKFVCWQIRKKNGWPVFVTSTSQDRWPPLHTHTQQEPGSVGGL